MNEIVFGFSTRVGFNPLAKIIQRAEGTPYSHTYIRYFDKEAQRWVIFQASGLEVNFMNVPTFLSNEKIIAEYSVQVTDAEMTKVRQFCVDNVSKPYGAMLLLGDGVVVLAKAWFGKKIKNPFPSGGRTLVCSMLVGDVLNILGLGLPQDVLEETWPKDCYNDLAAWNRAKPIAPITAAGAEVP